MKVKNVGFAIFFLFLAFWVGTPSYGLWYPRKELCENVWKGAKFCFAKSKRGLAYLGMIIVIVAINEAIYDGGTAPGCEYDEGPGN